MARRTVGRSAVNGISNVSALKMLNAARWLCVVVLVNVLAVGQCVIELCEMSQLFVVLWPVCIHTGSVTGM